MTSWEAYSRALIERVAADAGMTPEEAIEEQERGLYTLAASHLSGLTAHEAERARAEIERYLDHLSRGV